jgi:hypothetical protein
VPDQNEGAINGGIMALPTLESAPRTALEEAEDKEGCVQGCEEEHGETHFLGFFAAVLFAPVMVFSFIQTKERKRRRGEWT